MKRVNAGIKALILEKLLVVSLVNPLLSLTLSSRLNCSYVSVDSIDEVVQAVTYSGRPEILKSETVEILVVVDVVGKIRRSSLLIHRKEN